MSNRAGGSESAFWGDADESEALQRYRTLVNAIDDGIYQLDRDGHFVAVNEVIVETTGYTREELLGEHVAILLDAEDVSAIEREIQRRLAGSGDEAETLELDIRTADGDRIPCELRLNLLVEDGAFRGTIGVVRDVSERKRAERTLTEHERRIELESDLTDRLLKTSPVGIVVLDGDGAVEELNERAREILDVAESERGTYSPSDRPVYDEGGRPIPADEHPFARALETGEPVYDRVLQVERPDGERRWLSVNAEPIPNDEGEIEHVVTTGEDITDIKQRERELEAELGEIFGRVTDAFYALDDEWRITYANERAEDLIDYREEGLVGQDFWEVFEWAADSTLGEEYRTAMETQEPTSFEFYYPEPLESWYEVHAYPSETGLSVYFRDVTERKRRERELEESERRYRALVENFPNGAVALVDRGLRYRTVGGDPIVDDAAVEDLEGRLVGDALPRELADELVPRYEAALGGELGAFETELDGRIYQIRIVPVRDDDGEVFAALGMSQDVTERTERERELEEYRSRYQTLIENFPNGAVALVNRDLRYETFGGTPEGSADVTRGELEGAALRDALPSDLADVVVPRYEAALNGETAEVETTLGGEVYQFHFVPVRDDDGEVFAALGMSQNVTEQRERERYLRDAKAQLEAATEAGAVGTWEWHIPEDEFVTGASFARTFGVDPEAAREGVSIDRIVSAIHEDDRERIERRIEAVMDECGEYEEEYRVWNAEGELRWVVARGHVECDEEGDPVTFPGALTDITERKRAEQALHESEKQLRTLLRLLPVGVIVAEDGGRLVQKNDAAEEIWSGFAEADAVADYERYRGWWPESGEQVAPEEWPLARALRGEEITDSEVIEIEGFDGEHRTVLFHAMPIRNASGDVTRAVVTMIDVTEREERQQRLQEQNERLESFASMLAHELRNPVTIGQIYSQQLPDEADSEAVGYVAEAFDRIEDMIDIMLMMTRGQEAVDGSCPVSLADAAEDAWDEMDQTGRLRVEATDRVRGDETYLRHLFRNLFENAVQHGGTDVTVEVGRLRDGFYVADDGCGIPPEKRDAVFEAGFTTAKDAGGTGLGLAFVGELAEVYEWRCSVTESADGGARFEFRDVEFVSDE
ncbi:PAS domain S-box protein [Halorussus salilacus]|uniref:PAS domain S-box protein n=1 Tax=Halorussus salilacus TaxID=2953750 RepID=UPI0020A047D5|nr:PAS domain S-box protein [Halorussus salilacus]USZ67540.1 PAS domain S-box protein [Halorussus salilacus]